GGVDDAARRPAVADRDHLSRRGVHPDVPRTDLPTRYRVDALRLQRGDVVLYLGGGLRVADARGLHLPHVDGAVGCGVHDVGVPGVARRLRVLAAAFDRVLDLDVVRVPAHQQDLHLDDGLRDELRDGVPEVDLARYPATERPVVFRPAARVLEA